MEVEETDELPLPKNYAWMCDLCFVGGEEIGILAPGYSIIRKRDGLYYILGGQGHNGDEVVHFPTTPFPDPDPEMEADEDSPIAKEEDRWLEEADQFERAVREAKLTMSESVALYNACRDQYERSGSNVFEQWLFGRVGELIEIHEGKRPPEPRPVDTSDPNVHWNYRVMKHVDPLPKHLQTDGHPNVVWYGLHEYYYGLEGGDSWSCDPQPVVADSVEDLRDILAKMRTATMKEIVDFSVIRLDETNPCPSGEDGLREALAQWRQVCSEEPIPPSGDKPLPPAT